MQGILGEFIATIIGEYKTVCRSLDSWTLDWLALLTKSHMVFPALQQLANRTLPLTRRFSASALCVLLLAAACTLWNTEKPTTAYSNPTIQPRVNSTKMRIVPVPVRSDNYACEASTVLPWMGVAAVSVTA